MASTTKEDFEAEEDLIDLHVTSPVLPRSVEFCAVEETDINNLIDSELPDLEHKLLKAEGSPNTGASPTKAVNIEEILISLEAEEALSSNRNEGKIDSQRRNSSELLFDILTKPRQQQSSPNSPVSCEAMDILTKLDELLNESLRSTNQLLQEDDYYEEVDEDVQKLDNQNLEDLDEFSSSNSSSSVTTKLEEDNNCRAQTKGSGDSEETNVSGVGDETSSKSEIVELSEYDDNQGSTNICALKTDESDFDNEERSKTGDEISLSLSHEGMENVNLEMDYDEEVDYNDGDGSDDEETLEMDHREEAEIDHIDGNSNHDDDRITSEIVNTDSAGDSQTKEDHPPTDASNEFDPVVNDSPINEPIDTDSCVSDTVGPNQRVFLKRAVSNCGGDRGGNFKRNNRWRATVGSLNDVKSVPYDDIIGELPVASGRISAAGADSDEEIDWSWVHELEIERRAHAAGDFGTGSVLVEPVQRESIASGEHLQRESELEVNISDDGAVEDGRGEIEEGEQDSSWLRSSMRRIQHLRLPSDRMRTDGTGPLSPSAPPFEPEQFQEFQMNRLQGNLDEVSPSGSLSTANIGATRPVSAPSRLASRSSVATQSSVREQRPRQSRNRTTLSSTTVTAAYEDRRRERARSSSASSRSRRLRSLSSSESSLVSSIESAPSSTAQQSQGTGGNVRRSCDRPRYSDMPVRTSPIGHWPHSMSSMLACLGCTIGLFNISRFAILSVQFGANFILQFFILSIVIGLPLFTLQLCLGQQLGAGVIDMWRISPLFQGVGIALLVSQALIGLYSIIGISWMFVYFRDSFITKADRYRWAEPFIYYRDDVKPLNGTFKLSETVPDYFSGVVLQRHHLASGNAYSTIKFQLAFNLAVVWMIIFVSLSKGLRSYGKVIYVFILFPVFGMFVVCAKMLGIMPVDLIYSIFPETTWSEFFINSKSWIAASQEVFLTWGMLGACAMQIASHNKNKHLLQRDSSLIAMITFTILLLAAFLANTCVQLLHSYGYRYLPDSFEKITSYGFLRPTRDPLPANLASTPVRYMYHQSFIVGERVTRPGTDHTSESGYQALRFATELLPTTFAVMGANQLSPFWAVLFYFTLILFGITQQLAIWHCVITGIMAIKAKVLRSWETTITFFSCACGFVLGLPMATEIGIYVVYFFDFTVGGQWWMMLIILIQILAVFMVRGRPYSGDALVNVLFTSPSRPCILSWAPALLSFTWNVILPVALMVWCIVFFKNGNFRELFVWHHIPSLEYWPLWARQLGSMIQLLHVLCVPIVAVIQSYRYLNNGPDDILDDPVTQHNYRVQLLYRPPIGEHMESFTIHESDTITPSNAAPTTQVTTTITEDPPPKYTPPPSYTTATGARLAKFLRQSIRRSVRRITNAVGESSQSRPSESNNPSLPPPDYNAVLDEINNSRGSSGNTSVTVNVIELPTNNDNQRSAIVTSGRSDMEVNLQPGVALTAADVACILRNSFRRSARRAMNIFRRDTNENRESISAENLVESAAPIGQTSLNLENLSNDSHEVKPAFDNPSSVI